MYRRDYRNTTRKSFSGHSPYGLVLSIGVVGAVACWLGGSYSGVRWLIRASATTVYAHADPLHLVMPHMHVAPRRTANGAPSACLCRIVDAGFRESLLSAAGRIRARERAGVLTGPGPTNKTALYDA